MPDRFPPATARRASRQKDYSRTVEIAGGGQIGPTAALAKETGGNLDSVVAKLTTIDGRVDGLEALIGTTNSSLATMAGYLDGLEGYVDGLEAKLDTLHADVDGLETLVTATNAKLDALNTAIGAKSDAEWSSGDGSAIALLKAIATP